VSLGQSLKPMKYEWMPNYKWGCKSFLKIIERNNILYNGIDGKS